MGARAGAGAGGLVSAFANLPVPASIFGGGSSARGGGGGAGGFPRVFRPVISATPSPSFGASLHRGPEPPLFFDVRNCVCADDWLAKQAADPAASVCSCNGVACPAKVDPPFLTEAAGQGVCSLRQHTGYGCTVGCQPDGAVLWYGFNCGGEGQKACAPLVVSPSPTPTISGSPPPPIVVPVVTWDPSAVVDLHGVRCELLDGRERCFNEDTQGRTLCPAYVTSAYLRNPPTSGEGAVAADVAKICMDPASAQQFYCSVFCQDGNSRVQWWTHDVNWCYSPDGKGACPSRHPVVPADRFTVAPWSEDASLDERPCQAAFRAGQRPTPGVIEGLTVGMLTHEPVAFGRTLETYATRGFFELVQEFLVYMNQRSPGLESILRPYQDRYGHDKIKILGDATTWASRAA
jgi:hypothetical protein